MYHLAFMLLHVLADSFLLLEDLESPTEIRLFIETFAQA